MLNSTEHEIYHAHKLAAFMSGGMGFPTMWCVRQTDQSLCKSLEYSMNFKLLTELNLKFLNLKRRMHRLV